MGKQAAGQLVVQFEHMIERVVDRLLVVLTNNQDKKRKSIYVKNIIAVFL